VHVTLAFLGNQPRRVARELGTAAARISGLPFDLLFDHVDCWRKSAIAWAGVPSVPPALAELHRAIMRALVANGIEPDERPFAVHVTLARHTVRPVRRPVVPALLWRVSEFALVASELSPQGSRYRVLSRWPLLANV